MKLSKMPGSDKVLARQLKDPHFRAEWERTAVARAVAARLVEYRVEHELSQTALAHRLGMKQPAVARLEASEAQDSLLKRMYPQGLAVRQDPGQAAVWNTAAAEAHDAGAQARLGYQYASGFGVAPDLAAARQWFAASAAQGNVAGETFLRQVA